jgi:hypothetical protein
MLVRLRDARSAFPANRQHDAIVLFTLRCDARPSRSARIEREPNGFIRVKECRIERRQREMLGADQKPDLRASQDDAVGAGSTSFFHDLDQALA